MLGKPQNSETEQSHRRSQLITTSNLLSNLNNSTMKKNRESCIDTLNLSRISSSKQSVTDPVEKSDTTEHVNTMLKDIMKSNMKSISTLKLQVTSLEDQLKLANARIQELEKALLEERTKSIQKVNVTTSSSENYKPKHNVSCIDRLYSVRNNSVERCYMNNMSSLKTIQEISSSNRNRNKSDLKRSRSIETPFKSGLATVKSDHEEDLEFKIFELSAIYETEVDSIFNKKSKEQQTEEALQALRSIKNDNDYYITEINTIDKF